MLVEGVIRAMFGTSGIRGPLTNVSPELVQKIGRSVGSIADSVVVGRDGRCTGGSLVSAFCSGAQSVGCRVLDVGTVPTHTLAWSTREFGGIGVMVTASHNPPEDNGVKVFDSDGIEAGKEVEDRIVERLEEVEGVSWGEWSGVKEKRVLGEYLEDAAGYVDSDLGLRVAVDCGNGVGALTTPPLLRSLGCSVVGVNAQIDGSFPGRPPKPTPDNISGFREFIRAGDFDLGFAHDGDADRTLVIGGDGEVVVEDAVIALVAREYVDGDGIVVTTPNTSSRIDELVAEAGGSVERAPLGGLPEVLRSKDVSFAAEPWKHVFPEWGGWVDGSVAAAVVTDLVERAGGLEPLLSEVGDISISKRDVECPDDRKREVLRRVRQVLPEHFNADVDTMHGVRLDFSDGSWVLVRASGTEPLIRVYVEGGISVDEVVRIVEDAVERSG